MFADSINAERPHSLITTNSISSGHLEYQYMDTMEVVKVPNIWYNQTYQMRASHAIFLAERMDEKVSNAYKKYDGILQKSAIDVMVAGSKSMAEEYRQKAITITAMGRNSHPVQATKIIRF